VALPGGCLYEPKGDGFRPTSSSSAYPSTGRYASSAAPHPLPQRRRVSWAAYSIEPEGEHRWPIEIKSTALDRFNGGTGTTTLARVEPTVIETSADVARKVLGHVAEIVKTMS
jgi:hypothetical protein